MAAKKRITAKITADRAYRMLCFFLVMYSKSHPKEARNIIKELSRVLARHGTNPIFAREFSPAICEVIDRLSLGLKAPPTAQKGSKNTASRPDWMTVLDGGKK